ncbi:MAG: hypothetical protein KBG20_16665 [Caldilineaceae bacterium]|nr:hypothetical protein [Caldilineaceae bacterium]MBP8109012.1 hypothetical protein [Caldilineaceae bacterium]MBP8124427.1 hypothetical protein [Caldilineaceae bacterium]MBP9073941.1 hypothetical protein [Caldilineaceae bacterium]
MPSLVTSSPAKIILCGDHGVNRTQPALSTAISLRTTCRVSTRDDADFTFRAGDRFEACSRQQLFAFKTHVDALRRADQLDEIREIARDFFAPTRYVLSFIVEQIDSPGLDIEWRSSIPISSGLGSGAAAATSMALAVFKLAGGDPDPADLIQAAWQGDIIAHGGVASALDSSTCVHGGLIRYAVRAGAQPLAQTAALPLVVGQSFVADRSTAKINTIVRHFLEAEPARMHLFTDMGWLVAQIQANMTTGDLPALGTLFNLHELIQERIGSSAPENVQQIEAAIGAGAFGAKISGAGGGGIIIAIAEPQTQPAVIAAIEAVGGRAFAVNTGAPGTRVESAEVWEKS